MKNSGKIIVVEEEISAVGITAIEAAVIAVKKRIIKKIKDEDRFKNKGNNKIDTPKLSFILVRRLPSTPNLDFILINLALAT